MMKYQGLPTLCLILLCIVAAPHLAGAAELDGTQPANFASSRLGVRFDDATSELSAIVNIVAADELALVPESSFRFELDKLAPGDIPADLATKSPAVVIDARDCALVHHGQETAADGRLVRVVEYTSPHGRIEIEYTLGADDHFVQKFVRFTPSFPEAYLLRRVSVQQFRLPQPAGELVSFRHGRCMTHFVRRAKTGFFFGLQLPMEVLISDPQGTIDLCYDANYRYGPGERYEAEPAYWGIYKRAGMFAPPIPPQIDECRNADFAPDLGESAALLAMVERLTRLPSEAISINFNAWEGRMSRNGYGNRATPADIENDRQVLTLAKEQFGDFYTCSAIPWGGMGFDMPALGPESTEPPTSPLQREMLAWAREHRIRYHTWGPLKGICPWLGAHRYCPEYAAWWGRHEQFEYNCPASREFMEWYTRLLVAMIRRDGFGGFSLDEFFPGPRTALPCAATNHDHLPGDASYAYFVARRALFRTLRQEFGPEFCLEAARPNMDAGAWDMLYLDNVFTISESEKPGGDEIRYRARVRHYYHFVPSYMDQVYFRPEEGVDVDYLLLSALAVSNRHCVYRLGPTDEQRARIRFWYDWARANPDFMRRPVVFLPDWPGGGKCDTYVRTDGRGQAYAFVFNANDASGTASLPLDERSGLPGRQRYEIRRVFPTAATLGESIGNFSLEVPARQAQLISLRPTPE